ncbi:TetR/AcrR family transcriptional regulator [Nocardia sp. PE-7]|uniref:TetR/AcrR family transcriptional regulator n=1 Tax=Nocardia sp. PE-7 TaxID=3058426 RepID=UPI00265B706C|nr:TetR/AcrR family transcriptional regulator [Nocardia sp. PE-7]WKG11304.1 TetR/AcrR family transcriptional regulator [Nocardia sp. PE-7]
MSAARERLLDTATRLFYTEGVHTVGIDRIIAEAGIAKATFYRHFKTKEDLVVAYLQREYARQRDALESVPGEGFTTITTIFDTLRDISCGPGFRGCPFLNAAVEFPDPQHPVRRVVDEYRAWFRELMAEHLRAGGHPAPDDAARALLLTRDGVTISGGVGDSDTVRAGIRAALVHIA